MCYMSCLSKISLQLIRYLLFFTICYDVIADFVKKLLSKDSASKNRHSLPDKTHCILRFYTLESNPHPLVSNQLKTINKPPNPKNLYNGELGQAENSSNVGGKVRRNVYMLYIRINNISKNQGLIGNDQLDSLDVFS